MKTHAFYVSRRRFLKTSAAFGAGMALPQWFLERDRAFAAEPKRLSANDRPGIALIGCGGQGRGDCKSARKHGDVLVVCDVDDRHLEQAAQEFRVEGKEAPAKIKDFRKVMERDDIHVIINGTPDHWHTLINILAVKTGRDVYTEKPLTLTIDEGKRLVEAVRSSKRVLQVGTQQRSDRNFRLACELVRNGRIGKLKHMTVGLPTGPREGPFSQQPVPDGFDWDMYLGSTPKIDYNGKNAHWNFRWWYQFSGGQMTDWGAHHDDIAQWANGSERSGPVEVAGKSLIDMIPGGYDAASEYKVDFKYANGVTMTVTDGKRAPNGVKFEGPDGWIFVTRGKIEASKPELLAEPLADDAVRLYKSESHMGNFFDCVRSRKEPICDAEIGHRSISVAHLGVIAVRLGGKRLQWDPGSEKFKGEHAKEANQWVSREMRKPYDYSFIG